MPFIGQIVEFIREACRLCNVSLSKLQTMEPLAWFKFERGVDSVFINLVVALQNMSCERPMIATLILQAGIINDLTHYLGQKESVDRLVL